LDLDEYRMLLKGVKRKEVVDFLGDSTLENSLKSIEQRINENKRYLTLNNCLLDLETMGVSAHTVDIFTTNLLNYDYDPGAITEPFESYLDSTFDEIENPQLSYLIDRDTPRAPTWAGVAAFRYDWQIAADWGAYVRGLASYTGSHFVGADVPSEEKVGSYVIADATIGVSGPDERWDASIWCGNCFDESYRTIYFNSTFQPDSFSVYLNDPRRYGLSLRVRF